MNVFQDIFSLFLRLFNQGIAAFQPFQEMKKNQEKIVMTASVMPRA